MRFSLSAHRVFARRYSSTLAALLMTTLFIALLPLATPPAEAQQDDERWTNPHDIEDGGDQLGPWQEPDFENLPLPESAAFLNANGCSLFREDGNRALSLPLEGLPSTQTIEATAIFIDFSDVPATETLDEGFVDGLFGPQREYIQQVSGGRSDVNVTPIPRWIRMTQPSTSYDAGADAFPRDLESLISEAIALSGEQNSRNADMVYVVISRPDGWDFNFATSNLNYRLEDGTVISTGMTITSRRPSIVLHETLHTYGLPDLYDFNELNTNPFSIRSIKHVAWFDPMSEPSPVPAELMSYQKWLLGWIDDDQVDCITEFPSATPLAALGSNGGTQAAIVKLDKNRVLVVENRQDVRYDQSLFGFSDPPGLLVYVVDASVFSGDGPIRVKGESASPDFPTTQVLLQAGEQLVAGGYLIQAVPGTNGLEAHILEPCNGAMPTINMNANGGNGIGTPGIDVIIGTAGDDVIDGGGGNDLICSGGGNDTVAGGPGNDAIFAGAGNDNVNGGGDDDVISAGSGNDTVQGSTGNDEILGGQGDDKLFGSRGDDEIEGGPGDDIIHGNKGTDTLKGGAGADRIFGYADNDSIEGGDGDDRLHGNFGDDTILGGPGDDRIFGYGDDDILVGEDGNDLIVGNFGDDQMWGEAGLDTMFGSDGDDLVVGGDDNDRVFGNSGDDIIGGGAGNDAIDGGIGSDFCDGQDGFDVATRCEFELSVP